PQCRQVVDRSGSAPLAVRAGTFSAEVTTRGPSTGAGPGEGPSAGVGGDAAAPLPRLQQPADLGHLLAHTLGEPAPGDGVVQLAQHAAPELDLLDVMDAGTAVGLVDVEPGVHAHGHAVLEGDVDAVRRRPPVAGDDRPAEAA